MKRISLFLILTLLIGTSGILNAQIARQFGARRFVLDNNDNIPANNIYIIDFNGSLGIDNTGLNSGTYPNTTALVSLLAGTKTTNLRIDGGSVWGIDIVNTNNSIRTSGSNIFGSVAGTNVSTTINVTGTGSLTLTGIAAPASPSPLSNLLYLNASNQVQQTPGGVNVVTGNGTANTVPLWTGAGNTLGNSILTQPTTSTMVITPLAGGTNVLTVNNFNATSTAIKINANGGTAINIDPAGTGIQLDATGTGISFVNSNPTTGINLRAATTGINFVNAPTTGINLQAITTGINISGAATSISANSTIQTTGDFKTGPTNQLIVPAGAERTFILSGIVAGATGVSVSGQGFTSARSAVGTYTVTTNSPLGNINFPVMTITCNVFGLVNLPITAEVTTEITTTGPAGSTVFNIDVRDRTGALVDPVSLGFMIIGPR